MLKEIKIVKIVEMTNKTNGNKFNVYKTETKEHKLMDIKFTRAVKDIPTSTGILLVDSNNMSIDKNRKYPCLWVKEIEDFKPFESNEEKNLEILNEFFD